MTGILYKELSYAVVGAAMAVHKELGSAFLEQVYESALAHEFDLQGISYERQPQLLVFYKGKQVGWFKPDFIVEDKVILELKAVKAINGIHEAQAHNYLAASGLRLAIILNFGAPSLEYKRIVN